MNAASTLPAPTAVDIAHVFANSIHGWTLAPADDNDCDNGDRAVVVGPNGAELVFSTGSNDPGPGRIAIHGVIPRDIDGRTWTWKKHASKRAHSITCALTKSPEDIKRDVCNRLLPAFLAEHAEAQRYFEKRDEDECRVLGTAAQLASLLGEELQDSRAVEEVKRHGSVTFRHYTTAGVYAGESCNVLVRMGSNSETEVELKLTALTPEKAKAVLRLLKGKD